MQAIGIKREDFFLRGSWIDTQMTNNVREQKSNRDYWLQQPGVLRKKCLVALIHGSVGQTITLTGNVVYRTIKIITFSHFWKKGEGSLNSRVKALGCDALRIALTPLVFVGLIFACLRTIFGRGEGVRDGAKLYATLERFIYGENPGYQLLWCGRAFFVSGFRWAPCFQPQATSHFFGGPGDNPNAW